MLTSEEHLFLGGQPCKCKIAFAMLLKTQLFGGYDQEHLEIQGAVNSRPNTQHCASFA